MPNLSPASCTTVVPKAEAALEDAVASPRPVKVRPTVVSYIGFRTTAAGREYSLQVTGEMAPRVFVMLITHQAFKERETRFQDAPDLCSCKLRQDLQDHPEMLPGAPVVLLGADFSDYRAAHQRAEPGRRRRSPGA